MPTKEPVVVLSSPKPPEPPKREWYVTDVTRWITVKQRQDGYCIEEKEFYHVDMNSEDSKWTLGLLQGGGQTTHYFRLMSPSKAVIKEWTVWRVG